MRARVSDLEEVEAARGNREAHGTSKPDGLAHPFRHQPMIRVRSAALAEPMPEPDQPAKGDEGGQIEPEGKPSGGRDLHRRKVDQPEQVNDRNLAPQRPITFLDKRTARRAPCIRLSGTPLQAVKNHLGPVPSSAATRPPAKRQVLDRGPACNGR